ncbi:nucleoside hydrolase, partial [Pseudomonas frederiksbergensis]|nr:nucleoside hydrolase [Pseudomonas frederiksbergensis]
NAYVKADMKHYGIPGGPVHDTTVIAYLLKPELFTGRQVFMQVDSRDGPTFGQTITDWYGALKQPANVTWIADGDAQGFFDLLSSRLARLP